MPRDKRLDPKKLLPRGLTGWCMQCDGFVPTEVVKRREVRISRVVYYDDERQEGEYVECEYTDTISHCKTCGHYVDTLKIPSYVIDRLRFLAEIIHADTR